MSVQLCPFRSEAHDIPPGEGSVYIKTCFHVRDTHVRTLACDRAVHRLTETRLFKPMAPRRVYVQANVARCRYNLASDSSAEAKRTLGLSRAWRAVNAGA